MKKACAVATIPLGLIVSGLAWGQAIVPAEPSSTAASTVAPQVSESLGEVIVTAQRRSESIQRVGLAIDAIEGGQLARTGIVDAVSLVKLAPALQISNAGNAQIFYIRGIGALVGTSLGDPSISLNVGGVPMARPYMMVGQFYDLSRVEVLKGPQGTLYGRNATGGAINLIPSKPEFSDGLDLGIEVGNANLVRTNGAVNLKISDAAAVRGSFQVVRRDGFLSDGGQDDKNEAARLQFQFEPGERLSINVTGDYTHVGGYGAGAVEVAQFRPSELVAVRDPRQRALLDQSGQVALSYDNANDTDLYGVASTINYETDLGTLTFIPAYRGTDLDNNVTLGFNIHTLERQNQYSNEVRFSSDPSRPLKVVLGAFSLKEDVDTLLNTDPGFPIPTSFQQLLDYRADTRADAAFADATYSITPGLRLVGGLRYTRERKEVDGSRTDGGGGNIVLDASQRFSKVNYRAGFEADLAPESLLYATVATGFHSGGFYFTNDDPTFKPETIKAYTLGVKNRFFDRKLLLNVEAFRWQFRNQQYTHVAFDSLGAGILRTDTVGSLRIQGVETELRWQATPTTAIGGNVQYLDSEYLTFQYSQGVVPPTTGCPVAATGPMPVFNVDCSGRRPPQSPKWSIAGNIEQTIRLSDGSNFILDLQGRYQGRTLTGYEYLPEQFQDGYFVGDVLLTYNLPNSSVSLTAFVNNVTDETVVTNTLSAPYTGILAPGPRVTEAQILPPRNYGLRLQLHY